MYAFFSFLTSLLFFVIIINSLYFHKTQQQQLLSIINWIKKIYNFDEIILENFFNKHPHKYTHSSTHKHSETHLTQYIPLINALVWITSEYGGMVAKQLVNMEAQMLI